MRYEQPKSGPQHSNDGFPAAMSPEEASGTIVWRKDWKPLMKAWVAGPGFICIRLPYRHWHATLASVLLQCPARAVGGDGGSST